MPSFPSKHESFFYLWCINDDIGDDDDNAVVVDNDDLVVVDDNNNSNKNTDIVDIVLKESFEQFIKKAMCIQLLHAFLYCCKID